MPSFPLIQPDFAGYVPMRRRTAESRSVTRLPRRVASPAVGLSMPSRQRMVVVLPAPFGPKNSIDGTRRHRQRESLDAPSLPVELGQIARADHVHALLVLLPFGCLPDASTPASLSLTAGQAAGLVFAACALSPETGSLTGMSSAACTDCFRNTRPEVPPPHAGTIDSVSSIVPEQLARRHASRSRPRHAPRPDSQLPACCSSVSMAILPSLP